MPDADKIVSDAEEYRRVRLLNTEQFLTGACPQEIELDELGRAFAKAHEAYPDLSGWIYINEVPTPPGPGSLEFRELATRAVSVLLGVSGESDWKNWLGVLLAYLLQNDTQQEFLGIFPCGHFEGPAGTTSTTHAGGLVQGENYEIRHLFKVSEHCCTWLKRRYCGTSRSAPVDGEGAGHNQAPRTRLPKKAAVSNPPTGPFSASAVGASVITNRLQQAMAERGLNPPKLAREICALLKRKGGSKTRVDRSTIYRLIDGEIQNTNPAVWSALLEVLQLSEDETVHSMMRPPDK